MTDVIRLQRERPRGTMPAWMERAWDAVWDNFRALQPLVGYEDITFTPAAGANEVDHKLGAVPTRWTVIRSVDVTGAIYEQSTVEPTDMSVGIYCVSVGTAPSLTIRVWRE
jgi:hypothetical protein|tara:strand:+ start:9591 stop:9923 length:333 start_codon:yes stop_codon:yes gene_type:complete